MLRTLLAVASLAVASLAAADPYVTVSGGANFANDFGGTGPHVDFSALPDTGYVAALAIGTPLAISPSTAVELEISWRHNTLNGLLDVCGNEQPLGGSNGVFAALFNVRQKVIQIERADIDVFAGAGYGARRIVLEPTPDNWQNTSSGADEQGFVWQAGVGAEYPITDHIRAGLRYTYFVGPSTDRVAIWNGKSSFFESDGDNHAITMTLSADL